MPGKVIIGRGKVLSIIGKSKLPPVLFLILFALVTGLLSAGIIVTHGTTPLMMFLSIAVLLAGILYPRWVYLLAMVMIIVAAAVISRLSSRPPGDSFRSLIAGIANVCLLTEITRHAFAAKQKAEDTLRSSEERYRFLIENQGEGIAIIDPEERFTFCNRAAGQMFGLPSEELVGQSLREFTTPETFGFIRRQTQRRRHGKSDTYTHTIVRPDGERRHLLVTATPWLDTEGNFVGTFAVFRDDTERVQMEEQLRRRERFLLLLNEIAVVALETCDLDTMLSAIAARLSDLADADGCSLVLWDEKAHAVRSEVCYGMLCDSYRPIAKCVSNSMLVELTLHSSRPLIIEDASDLLALDVDRVSLLSLPLAAGERKLGIAVVFFTTFHHFTAREVAWSEQAARQISLALAKVDMIESERKRNAELEALRQASIKLTSSLELEPVLEAILEGALSLTGAKDAHAFLYDGERLSFGAAMWAPGSARELYHTPRPDGLTYSIAHSGELIIVTDARKHPLYQDAPWDGAIVGLPLRIGQRVVGVMNLAFAAPRSFDRAELRILELFADQAALAIENARLYHDLRERMAELQRTQQQLVSSARMAAIGQLAAGAAHELNNPLTTIIGYTDLLIAKAGDESTRSDLQAIERAAIRARNIVHSLLNFAGLGKMHLEKQDVNRLVQGIILLVSDAAHKAGVVIRECLAAELPPIVADAEQIGHALFNIMTNAIQAMPDGGELIVVTERRPKALNDKDCVAIAISDTGVGIHQADIPRIFEPFFTTREIGEGVGLGLSSALGIVKNHGGEILVESTLGVGSTFTVLLPMADE